MFISLIGIWFFQLVPHNAMFEREEWVRVIVSFHDEGWPHDLSQQKNLTAELTRFLLRSELSSGFEVVYSLETVPAMVGMIHRKQYEKWQKGKQSSLIRAIDLDIEIDLSEQIEVKHQKRLINSVSLIGADQLHQLGIKGENIEVGIIDSGIDSDHPDLIDALVAEVCFCGNALQPCCHNGWYLEEGPGSAEDDEGHGTHVSGIITSDGFVANVGVAPAVKISMVKALNSQGRGYLSNWIKGLDWMHANRPDLKIVNMSLMAGSYTQVCDSAPSILATFHRAAQNLYERGVLLVSIAGNQGHVGRFSAPGCISNIVSVGASDVFDLPWAQSNSHPFVDFFAPGVDIESSQIGGGVVAATGTSMAAPHLVGAGALLYQIHPLFHQQDLLELLKQSSPQVSDSHGLTLPRIDVFQAFEDLKIGNYRWVAHLQGDEGWKSILVLENFDSEARSIQIYPLKANGAPEPALTFELRALERSEMDAQHFFSKEVTHLALSGANEIYLSVGYQPDHQTSPVLHVNEDTLISKGWTFPTILPQLAQDKMALVNVGTSQAKVVAYLIKNGAILTSKHYGYVPRFGKLKINFNQDFAIGLGDSIRVISSQPSQAIFLRYHNIGTPILSQIVATPFP